MRAIHVDPVEGRKRMHAMHSHLRSHDVRAWADAFLTLSAQHRDHHTHALAPRVHVNRSIDLHRSTNRPDMNQHSATGSVLSLDPDLRAAVLRVARVPHLLVACDYDGTLAPIVADPTKATPRPSP